MLGYTSACDNDETEPKLFFLAEVILSFNSCFFRNIFTSSRCNRTTSSSALRPLKSDLHIFNIFFSKNQLLSQHSPFKVL